MTLLINRAEIAKYKQISKSVFDDVLNMHIREAQFSDIRPLLGEQLFNAILKTPADFTEILDGGEYTHNGITYYNYGLKATLCYYAYGRYLMFGNVTDTPFSTVEKLNGAESKPMEYSTKKSIWNENKDIAYNYFVSLHEYLVRTNNQLYFKNRFCKQPNQATISKLTK